jgi:hypothetical protein
MSHESSSSESYGSDDTGESSSDDAIYDPLDPFLDCLRDIRANDDLTGRQEETELGTHPMVDFRGVDSENLLNDTIDPIRHESEQALSPEASKQQTPSEPVPTAPPMPVATAKEDIPANIAAPEARLPTSQIAGTSSQEVQSLCMDHMLHFHPFYQCIIIIFIIYLSIFLIKYTNIRSLQYIKCTH